jgi:ubiquinone/menaquinone biosynthesis C-methylase UbiE
MFRHASRGSNVMLQIGDIFDLHFEAESFDHIFVCFVLEHLSNPVQALLNLKKVLQIYPLLYKAGFSDCLVSPRMVYVDSSKPFLVEGFIKNTYPLQIDW